MHVPYMHVKYILVKEASLVWCGDADLWSKYSNSRGRNIRSSRSSSVSQQIWWSQSGLREILSQKKKNIQPELQIIYNSLTIWTVERASCEDRKIIWGLSCSIKEQMEPRGNEEEENMIAASGVCHYSLAETKPCFPLRGCLGLQKNTFTQEDTRRPVEMAQCLWALRGSQFYSQDPHGYPTFSSDLLGLLHACGEHTSCLS